MPAIVDNRTDDFFKRYCGKRSFPRLPCMFLINAGVEEDGRSYELIDGFNEFVNMCCENGSSRCMDVAVASYGEDITVIRDFSPPEEIGDLKVSSGSASDIVRVLDAGMDLVDGQIQNYRRDDVNHFNPLIIVFSRYFKDEGRADNGIQDQKTGFGAYRARGIIQVLQTGYKYRKSLKVDSTVGSTAFSDSNVYRFFEQLGEEVRDFLYEFIVDVDDSPYSDWREHIRERFIFPEIGDLPHSE